MILTSLKLSSTEYNYHQQSYNYKYEVENIDENVDLNRS